MRLVPRHAVGESFCQILYIFDTSCYPTVDLPHPSSLLSFIHQFESQFLDHIIRTDWLILTAGS